MKIEHYDALSVPGNVFDRMSKETRESYEGFMESHWRFLKEYCPQGSHKIKGIHHALIGTDEISNNVVGYRYFYFPIESEYCELFNILVDSAYRRRGYATTLIKKSLEISLNRGVRSFIVRTSSRSEERDALVKKYRSLAKEYCPPSKFTIYYDGNKYNYE